MLFRRYENNPILTANQWLYPANAVFNPGAIKVDDETVLLVRVEDLRGFSHLTVARSKDGMADWRIDPSPTLQSDTSVQEERWGLRNRNSCSVFLLGFNSLVQQTVPRIPQKVYRNQGIFLDAD